MSRFVDMDVYKVSAKSEIPVRWTAIEVFEQQAATIKSDVWS
jgi:hypothetical protein